MFKKLSVLITALILCAGTAFAGFQDRFSKIELMPHPTNYERFPAISAPSSNPSDGYGWLYVKENSGTTNIYFEDDGGTVTNLMDSAATATGLALAADGDAGDYDIKSIATLEFYDANLIIDGSSDGVLSITSDGTFEIDSADWDISTTGTITNASMSADQISAAALTIGDYYLSIGADPADAGDIRLDNDVNIAFEAAPAGTDIVALSVDSSEVVQIAESGASGVTITPALTCSSSISATTGTFSGAISATDGTFSGDVSVTGTIKQDALVASTASTTITLDGTGAGGVTIGGTSTGAITLGANGSGATAVTLPATVDMTLSGGTLSVTDTASSDMVTFTNNTATTSDLLSLASSATRTSNYMLAITDAATTASTIGITANAMTSGYGFSYGNTGAGLTGAAINLSVTDGGGFTGDYIRCYDGSAEDFTVERYGEVTVGGLANSDMITITAGDFQMTDGYIDVDDGYIAVNTDEDHTTSFTRDLATAATSACVLIDDTNPAGTTAKPALEINQDCTGNSTGIKISHDGDYPVIDIDAGAARTGDVIDIAMANMLAERAMVVSGAWTGVSAQGLIDLHTTGQIAAGGSMIRIDADTAKAEDASDGYMLYVDDDTTVADTPSVYAVKIDANANEALNVSKGTSIFAETTTFTSGITDNGSSTLGDAVTDGLTITAAVQGATPIVLDGSTDDASELTFGVTDPSTDFTAQFADYGGSGSSSGAIPIVIAQGYTQTSQAGAGTSDVTGSSLTIADGWFTEGKTIRYTVVGTVVGANAAIGVDLYFEDGSVMALDTANGAAGDYVATFEIVGTASNTQRIQGMLRAEGGAELIVDYATDNTDSAAAGTIPIKVQITSGNGGDTITAEMVKIEAWDKSD